MPKGSRHAKLQLIDSSGTASEIHRVPELHGFGTVDKRRLRLGYWLDEVAAAGLAMTKGWASGSRR